MKSLGKLRKLIRASRPQFLIGLVNGVVPSLEHENVLRQMKPLQTILDIGANRGQFSIMARSLNPDAQIIAFEPLVAPSKTMARIFRRDPKLSIHTIALADLEADRLMNVSARDDSSSLLKIGRLQEDFFPGTGLRTTELVRAMPLANVVAESDLSGRTLLKIDVQGGELGVLKGAGKLLTQCDFIYVEASFVELYEGQPLAADIFDFLSTRGFAIVGVYNATYDPGGRAIQADLLFEAFTPN